MRRSPLPLALLAASAALALGVAACGGDDAGTGSASAASSGGGSTTLRVGYIGTGGQFNGPEGYAYSTGDLQKWLRPAGVTAIKPVEFANGPLATQALVGGSLDMIIAGDTPQLIAQSQGVPARAILQNRTGINAWLIARKGGPTSVAALAGKKVARQQASFQDRYLQGLLGEQGLTGKATLTAMLNPVAITALRSGSLDAAAIAVVQAKPLADPGFPVLDKSDAHPELQGTSITTIATKFDKAHPKVADAWIKARAESVELAKANASAYYAYDAKAQAITPEVDRAWSPLSSYSSEPWTATGTKQLRGTLDFLVGQKLAKPFDLASWGVRT
jgi:sulfonate transport system substrate-binding protein